MLGDPACYLRVVWLRELAESLQRPRSLDDLLRAEKALRRLAMVLYRERKEDRPLCGARCRGPLAGQTCRAHCVPGKGRCRMHGGLSTGPRTPGAAARAGRLGGLRWGELRRAA